MIPMDLAPTELFGTAALVVAMVAAINKMTPPEFSGRWLLLTGAVSSVVVTLVWAYAHQPMDWTQVPLEALTAWLTAMGVYSGGKALVGK